MFNKNFYPTPPELVEKMLECVDLSKIKTLLEPSAGKGDIINIISKKCNSWKHYVGKAEYHEKLIIDIDCIEIDENLRYILRGKGYRVMHDDFLTLNTYKNYDLIIMNPPFDQGDKHLLKAIDMQKNGGKIVCLLNAETIRNQFSNVRKDLVRKLEEYDANIEYIDNLFTNAEHQTDVQIALINIDIPKNNESIILNGLRNEESVNCNFKTEELIDSDPLKQIIQRYNFEIKAGVKLINEHFCMLPYLQKHLHSQTNTHIINLSISGLGDQNDYGADVINCYIQNVREKYWETLFQTKIFNDIFTQELRNKYSNNIHKLKDYDFSEYNINEIKKEISKEMMKSVENTILDLFDTFSRKHNWFDETSKNIHYYNGWKTNKAWKINKKVIIPLNAYEKWRNVCELKYKTHIYHELMDIEKVFNYLDGNLSQEVNMDEVLACAQKENKTSKIRLKYFDVSFFKKGTTHIEFTNLELLKKFNIFGSQRKGWLPPTYTKANYSDMTKEAQAVIDEFEGKEEYEKTIKKKDYFIYKTTQLLAIGQGQN